MVFWEGRDGWGGGAGGERETERRRELRELVRVRICYWR